MRFFTAWAVLCVASGCSCSTGSGSDAGGVGGGRTGPDKRHLDAGPRPELPPQVPTCSCLAPGCPELACKPVVVAEQLGTLTSLTAAAGNYFLTTADSVFLVPRGGVGMKVKLATGQAAPRAICVQQRGQATDVYWANNTSGEIMRVQIAPDGTPGTAEPLATGAAGVGALAVAAGGQSITWTNSVTGDVWQSTLDPLGNAGKQTKIASAQAGPSAVLLDGASVYWVNTSGGQIVGATYDVQSSVWVTKPVFSGLLKPSALKADSKAIYFVTDGTVMIATRGANGTFDAPVSLIAGQTGLTGFSVDERGLSWANGNGDIFAAPRDATSGIPAKPGPIATGQDPTVALATVPERVAWITTTVDVRDRLIEMSSNPNVRRYTMAEQNRTFVVQHRPFHLHMPPDEARDGGDTRGTKRPLVVVLGGYQVAAVMQEAYLQIRYETDREGAIYVSPESSRDQWGQPFWNGGACCQIFAAPDTYNPHRFEGWVDDVQYIDDVIDEVIYQVNWTYSYAYDRWNDIDLDRIYVIGHSSGGFMAHRYACSNEGMNRVAAIVTLAGTLNLYSGTGDTYPMCGLVTKKRNQVSVLQIHATNDHIMNFSDNALYNSSQISLHLWNQRDGCADPVFLPLDGGAPNGGSIDLIPENFWGQPAAGDAPQNTPYTFPAGPRVGSNETQVYRSDCASSPGIDTELWKIVGPNIPFLDKGGHAPVFYEPGDPRSFGKRTMTWLLAHKKVSN